MTLSESDISHLIRRTEIISTDAKVNALINLESREAAVDAILARNSTGGITRPEGITRSFYLLVQTDQWYYDNELRRWWINEMAFGSQPLREKMTLFWHGHFVCSEASSPFFTFTLANNQLYRENAFGNLVDFAKKMAVDPVMLQYLNNGNNIKNRRNENFARELMELFLLGLNHYGLLPSNQAWPYTQDDVVAASKAWTGHNMQWPGNQQYPYYEFRPEFHDDSVITFLGKTGKFDGFGIIDHILTTDPYKQIAARYIATKLWSYFAYPDPDVKTVIDIVNTSNFANTMDIKALLRTILVHPDFYSDKAKQGLASTPAEYTARVMYHTGTQLRDDFNQSAIYLMEDMGQRLLTPPNVAGWKNNSYWLSTSALGARGNLLRNYFNQDVSRSKFIDLENVPAQQAVTAAARRLGLTTLQPTTLTNITNWLNSKRVVGVNAQIRSSGLLHLLAMSPDFQLS